MRTAPLAVLVFALASCEVVGDPNWVGSFTSTGTWDLGGPLADGRTVGDAVADLLVEQLVSVLGVPSPLEDQAGEVLDGAVRPAVKAVVDPNAPAELGPGGSVTALLAATLAKVKVESELSLERGLLPGSMKGTETFTSFAFEHEDKTYTLDAKELSKLGVSITAEWSGKGQDADELEVDPHAVEIEFGELVRKIADLAVDLSGQTELTGKVKSAVSCEQIVAAISPDGKGLTIAVSDWSKALSTEQLQSACAKAVPMIEERVLGLFKKDTTVEIGGTARFVASANELRSGEGFGGLVALCPRPVAPRLHVEFTAKRK